MDHIKIGFIKEAQAGHPSMTTMTHPSMATMQSDEQEKQRISPKLPPEIVPVVRPNPQFVPPQTDLNRTFLIKKRDIQ